MCVCVCDVFDYLKLQMLDLHMPGALENNPKILLYTLTVYPWGPKPQTLCFEGGKIWVE